MRARSRGLGCVTGVAVNAASVVCFCGLTLLRRYGWGLRDGSW